MNRFNAKKAIHQIYWALVLLVATAPAAQAGIVSQGLCRPYRQLVDNELFMMVGLIVAVILVVAWKLAPSGSLLAKGVGLLAAMAIGLNLESLMQASFGSGIAC